MIVLKALDMLGRFEHALRARPKHVGTHSTVDQHIARFDAVAVIELGAFRFLKVFRTASLRVREAAGVTMDACLQMMADGERARLAEITPEGPGATAEALAR